MWRSHLFLLAWTHAGRRFGLVTRTRGASTVAREPGSTHLRFLTIGCFFLRGRAVATAVAVARAASCGLERVSPVNPTCPPAKVMELTCRLPTCRVQVSSARRTRIKEANRSAMGACASAQVEPPPSAASSIADSPSHVPLWRRRRRRKAAAWARGLSSDEGDVIESSFYVNAETIFKALADTSSRIEPVKLVKSSWLLERADAIANAPSASEAAALAVPRRQELERTHPEAFFTVEELRRLPRGHERSGSPLAIAAISHAWLTPQHPDPKGEQLVAFASVVRRAQNLELQSQQPEAEETGDAPKELRRFPAEFGVFYDWLSLPQKNAAGKRSSSELAAFRKALMHMELWYVHQMTAVVILSKLPEAWQGHIAAYGDRGWPTCERAWAMLVKLHSKYAWPMILDAGEAGGEPTRHAPIHPDELESMLELKRFTSRAADLPLVLRLYRQTVVSVLGGVEALKFGRLGWGNQQTADLADVLPLCKRCTKLNLHRNAIGGEGVTAIVQAVQEGALPNLSCLRLSHNPLGDAGAQAIAKALSRGGISQVQQLKLEGCGSTTRLCERQTLGLHPLGSRPGASTTALTLHPCPRGASVCVCCVCVCCVCVCVCVSEMGCWFFLAGVAPACEAGRGAVAVAGPPTTLSPFPLTHTHPSSTRLV